MVGLCRFRFGSLGMSLRVTVMLGRVLRGAFWYGSQGLSSWGLSRGGGVWSGSQGGARYLWLGDVRSGMVSYGKAVKFRSGM